VHCSKAEKEDALVNSGHLVARKNRGEKMGKLQRARRVGCGEPPQDPEENAYAYPPGNPIAPLESFTFSRKPRRSPTLPSIFKNMSGAEAEEKRRRSQTSL